MTALVALARVRRLVLERARAAWGLAGGLERAARDALVARQAALALAVERLAAIPPILAGTPGLLLLRQAEALRERLRAQERAAAEGVELAEAAVARAAGLAEAARLAVEQARARAEAVEALLAARRERARRTRERRADDAAEEAAAAAVARQDAR